MNKEIFKDIKDFGAKTIKHVRELAEAYKVMTAKNPPLDRHLTADGLELAFSSHPKETNETLARMKETLAKREAREGKEDEVPSNIVMSKPDRKGVSKFTFDFQGQSYKLEGLPSLPEFTKWITEYTETAETCITCDRLMFPGEPVGACDDGLMHMTFDCCPSGGFYAGHINGKGQLKPLDFEEMERSLNNPQ